MNEESDGETAIAAILRKMNVSFEPEKVITGLKGDTHSYRKADFYLPDYDIFVEFFGGWDTPNPKERKKERARYNKKKMIYNLNGIKCIYIYPNQLHYANKLIRDGVKLYGGEADEPQVVLEPLSYSGLSNGEVWSGEPITFEPTVLTPKYRITIKTVLIFVLIFGLIFFGGILLIVTYSFFATPQSYERLPTPTSILPNGLFVKCESNYTCFLDAIKNDCASATFWIDGNGKGYDFSIQKLRSDKYYCELAVVGRFTSSNQQFLSNSYGVSMDNAVCKAGLSEGIILVNAVLHPYCVDIRQSPNLGLP